MPEGKHKETLISANLEKQDFARFVREAMVDFTSINQRFHKKLYFSGEYRQVQDLEIAL